MAEANWREEVFRWVLSPIGADGVELVRAYAREVAVAHQHEGKAMCYCRMTRGQLVKARTVPDLVVEKSLHLGHLPVHPTVAAHHAHLGVTPQTTLHDFLAQMAEFHAYFEPIH